MQSEQFCLTNGRDRFSAQVQCSSELLPQVVDAKYPGPGKALISFAWSPFAVEKDVILVGASDADGLRAGVRKLLEIASGKR